MNEPTLRETQQLVWKLITAPEGVAQAIAAQPAITLPIRGDHRLSAAMRLDIYANMYFYRIRDSLKEDFPAVLALIGEDRFHNLITDYLLAHPSEHWSLRYTGAQLPAFLATHGLGERWPWIGELARFEWELIETFDAPTVPFLSRARLTTLLPDQWAGLRFQLVPSLRLFRSAFRVDLQREALLAGHDLAEMKAEAVTLIVWQQELAVNYRSIDAGEERLLQAITVGKTFAELCELAAAGADAAMTIAAPLERWLAGGLLADWNRS